MLQNKPHRGKKVNVMFLLNQPLPSRLGPSLGALLLWEGWGLCQEAAEDSMWPTPRPNLFWYVVHGTFSGPP